MPEKISRSEPQSLKFQLNNADQYWDSRLLHDGERVTSGEGPWGITFFFAKSLRGTKLGNFLKEKCERFENQKKAFANYFKENLVKKYGKTAVDAAAGGGDFSERVFTKGEALRLLKVVKNCRNLICAKNCAALGLAVSLNNENSALRKAISRAGIEFEQLNDIQRASLVNGVREKSVEAFARYEELTEEKINSYCDNVVSDFKERLNTESSSTNQIVAHADSRDWALKAAEMEFQVEDLNADVRNFLLKCIPSESAGPEAQYKVARKTLLLYGDLSRIVGNKKHEFDMALTKLEIENNDKAPHFYLQALRRIAGSVIDEVEANPLKNILEGNGFSNDLVALDKVVSKMVGQALTATSSKDKDLLRAVLIEYAVAEIVNKLERRKFRDGTPKPDEIILALATKDGKRILPRPAIVAEVITALAPYKEFGFVQDYDFSFNSVFARKSQFAHGNQALAGRIVLPPGDEGKMIRAYLLLLVKDHPEYSNRLLNSKEIKELAERASDFYSGLIELVDKEDEKEFTAILRKHANAQWKHRTMTYDAADFHQKVRSEIIAVKVNKVLKNYMKPAPYGRFAEDLEKILGYAPMLDAPVLKQLREDATAYLARKVNNMLPPSEIVRKASMHLLKIAEGHANACRAVRIALSYSA